MGFRTQSQKMFRFQASLIAFLYLFLCTVGALTHYHAPSESASGATLSQQSASTLHSATFSASHCAYCDWQADSVSPALAPTFLIGIETRRVVLPAPALSRSFAPPSFASSRAPPIA